MGTSFTHLTLQAETVEAHRHAIHAETLTARGLDGGRNLRTAEALDRPTAVTHLVEVVAHTITLLVERAAAEMQVDRKTATHEEVQGAVDGGTADVELLVHLLVDVIDREQSLVLIDILKDGVAFHHLPHVVV